MNGGMLVARASLKINALVNMCLSVWNNGGGYTGDDRDGRAFASDSSRFSVLPASVHCNSVDGVEAKEMTAKEVFEKVLSYGTQYDDTDIIVRIRNDETGDYLKITDVWVDSSGDVIMSIERLERDSDARE
jgi:mannose/cellobiose epimerase-like protein (N-acyl-D-glucosamine 2-epimerase family)